MQKGRIYSLINQQRQFLPIEILKAAAAIAGTASVKHTAREATNATIFLQETVCVQYFATHSSPLLGYAVC
jgi:hypothetical protein